MSDLLNTFSAAGLWIETTAEPQLSAEDAERHPHKQAVMNAYLGILVFKLRPLLSRRIRADARTPARPAVRQIQ